MRGAEPCRAGGAADGRASSASPWERSWCLRSAFPGACCWPPSFPFFFFFCLLFSHFFFFSLLHRDASLSRAHGKGGGDGAVTCASAPIPQLSPITGVTHPAPGSQHKPAVTFSLLFVCSARPRVLC